MNTPMEFDLAEHISLLNKQIESFKKVLVELSKPTDNMSAHAIMTKFYQLRKKAQNVLEEIDDI